jgi:hypothetical protein
MASAFKKVLSKKSEADKQQTELLSSGNESDPNPVQEPD